MDLVVEGKKELSGEWQKNISWIMEIVYLDRSVGTCLLGFRGTGNNCIFYYI